MTTTLTRQEQVGTFRFPEGMGAFIVEGRCMEPAFPDGSMVFAVRDIGKNIAIGTPVVVLTRFGIRYCKLWNGQCEDAILLLAMNSGPDIQKHVALLHSEVSEVWIVLGVWFNERPLVKRCDEDKITEEPCGKAVPPAKSTTRQVVRSRRRSA